MVKNCCIKNHIVDNKWLKVCMASVLHFLVDGLCLCCLCLVTTPHIGYHLFGVFLTYNILAFMTQPLTGYYADIIKERNWLLLSSIVLLSFSVLFVILQLHFHDKLFFLFYLIATLLGVGNSLFHVWGGKMTAVNTDNDIRAIGLFVSTGALGLSIGYVFHAIWLLCFFLLFICLFSLAYFAVEKQEGRCHQPIHKKNIQSHHLPFSIHKYQWIILGTILIFVMFRSYYGEVITSGTAKTTIIVLTIGVTSMFGKMVGGWLCHLWGILKVMTIVLIVALVCCFLQYSCLSESLVSSSFRIIVLLTGLFMINCTMSVTLYLANIILKGKEGLAFGLLAAVLIPGYLLAYFNVIQF